MPYLVSCLPGGGGYSQTLNSPSNYYIQSKAAENDTLGLIWWKCDSLFHGDLFTTHRSHTGLGSLDTMKIDRIWDDPFDCTKHASYVQFHGGLMVENAEIRENWNPENNSVITTSGLIVENIALSTSPSISDSLALIYALNTVNGVKYAWEDDSLEYYLREDSIPGLTTYYPTGELLFALVGDRRFVASNYILAWRFKIWAIDSANEKIQTVYVDATSGDVIKIIEDHSEGTFNHIFYGNQYLDTRWYGGLKQSHFLWSNDNNTNIKSRGGPWTKQNIDAWRIGRLPDVSNDNWGNNHWAATSAHHVIWNAWEYFHLAFDRNGLDGYSCEIRIQSDYSFLPYQNAEHIHYGLDYIRFSRGFIQNTSTFKSYLHLPVSYDVGGHEFTHGIAKYSMKNGTFVGTNISGAISESYGDIFGFLCERHAQPNSWDWIFGEDISDDYNEFPTREFTSPNTHSFDFGGINGFPYFYPSSVGGINYYNYQLYPTDDKHDYGGIHINCSVQDKCFHLLSMGGTQLGKTVGGIGIDAAAKIAYCALTNYATPNETWELSRLHWITAAEKIFKKCSYEANQTCRAWSAVNVGPFCEPCALANRPCYGCTDQSIFGSVKSIGEMNQPQFRVYPNPTNDLLNVEFLELTSSQLANFQYKIYIYSNIGEKIFETVVSGRSLKIDVSQLSQGVYFVQYVGDVIHEMQIFEKN